MRPPAAATTASHPPPRRGFSLVELLVVIAIIALVVSVILVAIRAARAGSDRAATGGMLRSLGQAHATYATDNRGALVPGYLTPALQNDLDIRALLDDGFVVPQDAAATWVWRLLPYLDHRWQSVCADADASDMARFAVQYGNRDLDEISIRPSFGLNSIFIGGDSISGGSGIVARSPWNTAGNSTIAATRLTELRSPSNLVLFGPTRLAEAPGDLEPDRGWWEFRAPRLDVPQWTTDHTGIVVESTLAGPAGVPALRAGRALPVGFADGSAGTVDIDDLARDMRRWTPLADRPDWSVP